MDYSPYRGGRLLEGLCLILLTVTEVTSRSLTECFYEIGTIRGVTYLGSMFCQYGCCGTSQDQRCCSREEKYPDEDEGRIWRIVALAFAGVIIVLALSLVACWILKKKNRKNVRVRTTNYSATGASSQPRCTNQSDIFAINFREPARQPQPPAYSYLPKYSETVQTRGNGLPPIAGYTDGNRPGFTDGTRQGYTNGNQSGYPDGYQACYTGTGYTDVIQAGGSNQNTLNPQTGEHEQHISHQRPSSPPPSYAP